MQHTVNQLQQWAKEPDLGVKSFASSILLTSRSIYLPYQGMVLDRTSNSREGFVFRAESCSGICSGQRFNSGLQCSFCDLQKKCGPKKIRQSIKPSTGCVGKRTTIQKISNPAMVAMGRGKRSGVCVVSLLGQFYRNQLKRMGHFCWTAHRATRLAGRGHHGRPRHRGIAVGSSI
jgi:hypothetical protein